MKKKSAKKCSCGMPGKTLTNHKMGCEVMAEKIKEMLNAKVNISIRSSSLVSKKGNIK